MLFENFFAIFKFKTQKYQMRGEVEQADDAEHEPATAIDDGRWRLRMRRMIISFSDRHYQSLKNHRFDGAHSHNKKKKF